LLYKESFYAAFENSKNEDDIGTINYKKQIKGKKPTLDSCEKSKNQNL